LYHARTRKVKLTGQLSCPSYLIAQSNYTLYKMKCQAVMEHSSPDMLLHIALEVQQGSRYM